MGAFWDAVNADSPASTTFVASNPSVVSGWTDQGDTAQRLGPASGGSLAWPLSTGFDAFSVEIVYKLNPNSGSLNILVWAGGGGSGYPTGGVVYGGGFCIGPTHAFVSDEWNHLVLVCDGITAQVWENGVRTPASYPAGGVTVYPWGNPASGTPTIFVGCSGFAGANPVNPSPIDVAAFCVYGYALPPERIIAHLGARNTPTYAPTDGMESNGYYFAAVTEDNPLLYYRCDESAGTLAVDRSGNGNNGAYVHPSAITLGKPSILSDGDTAFQAQPATDGGFAGIATPIIAYGTQVSYEALIYPTGGSGVIIDLDQYLNNGLMLFDYINRIDFSIANGTTGAAVSSPPISLNAWHHVVGTFDGATIKVYIDGALAGSTPAVTPFTPTMWHQVNFLIAHGRYGDNAVATFPGSLDEIAFYNYALTPAQVAAHYAAITEAPVAPPPAPVTGTDEHFLLIKVYSKTGALKDILQAEVTDLEIQDTLNGGSGSGRLTIRRDAFNDTSLGFQDQVLIWFWHGKDGQRLNPWWGGYISDIDTTRLKTDGEISYSLEGNMKLLDAGMVSESINPGLSESGSPGGALLPQLDAGDFLRSLVDPNYGDAPPNFGGYSIPTSMFNLLPMQWTNEGLGQVIDDVVKSGRSTSGQMFTWVVRTAWNLRSTLIVQPDQNPNTVPGVFFKVIFVDGQTSDYKVSTKYRDIVNVILVEGGSDVVTGQQLYRIYEDAASIAEYDPIEAAVSNSNLCTADACDAYGAAYADIHANPSAQGNFELLDPDPDIFAGTWLQIFEDPHTIKQVRASQIQVKWNPSGRVSMVIQTDAPTPYLDDALYQLGQTTKSAIAASTASLRSSQQQHIRLGGVISAAGS